MKLNVLLLLICADVFVEGSNVNIVHVTDKIGQSCMSVCQSKGLTCYDNFIEEMQCASAATEACGVKSVNDLSESIHCDKGGCYANCRYQQYADRGTAYMTCYSEPSCHMMSAGSHTFSQVCPCAIVDDSGSIFHIMTWQVVGIAILGTLVFVLVIATLHYFFPSLFPTRDSIYKKMGFGGDSPSFMDSIRQVPQLVSDWFVSLWEAICNKVSGAFSSVRSSVEASSAAAAESRRKRRLMRKKKRGQHSALNTEMDESMDMEIG
eukprot:CAMPEP_0185025576 /NCGR_PEP_ID=MMETSP1103-20130426/8475_1 /TAXON_ID=36769 /ORGANISM="Paraphysomonas bandaiensis, Strain Caron Lab Isolate" /LENGTH=263 /DNA_ID=CAMNT_0027558801 /DNA_START=212 /DNA_END=1006 /DNA_ORIENTATION=+